ncbi:oxygen-insensitive NADPH nitroreductase [Geobacillus sp. 44B]|uniref:oxygen-insensitive NADPH nitroreductase n=1 Tax=Saccharococcus caldoxylosilyticus TaxID=81408 RepID=UPI0009BFDD9F|nr:oxygen-insensitive NADPH nitroreductase [Parageobacillus caldoxylosilyticus]OQO98675.1 nitroreductase A [Geobacillus sp. 44B]QNU37294.1 oxygen-insensitive NADPH nitroreductase [Geobacillus sp. 44B]BDG43287.1 FMN reductase (NADPH) [Parageobacillus caldoxylosilyticus]
MNPVIETILRHRSIRQFEDRPLTDEQIRTIVECAQAASTSSFIQAYSIIGVKDKEMKRKLAELAGNQSYVEHNGHFFVFCADLHRHEVIGEVEQKDVLPSLESTEKFMVALVDTALAAQNAAIAAESMGLGVCYIGGLRNNLPEVCKLLKVPKRVIPLFGLAVGYPAQQPDKKPRLPFEHVYHEETYEQDRSKFEEQLKQYNDIVSAYYEKRTNGKRRDTWTGQMANMLSNQVRMYMKEFVEGKGFNLR